MATPEFFERIGSFLQVDPAAAAVILNDAPDRLVPLFILTYLPHGIIGLLFVAVLSALMSSLDSALNSMSAVTLRDFYQRYIKKDADEAHYLKASKLLTIGWGVFCVGFALVFAVVGDAARQTTLVLINAIGSLLYGPILAVFLLGIVTRTVSALGVKVGIVAGVGANVVLWIGTSISWMWWNVTGLVIACAVALLISVVDKSERRTPSFEEEKPSTIRWSIVYGGIVVYFALLIVACWALESALGS